MPAKLLLSPVHPPEYSPENQPPQESDNPFHQYPCMYDGVRQDRIPFRSHPAQTQDSFLCLCRTFLLLEFTVTSAKFSLRRTDSNIMYISCRFQNIEQLLIQMLFLPDQLSKAVHLHEMLDSRRVISVKLNLLMKIPPVRL